MFSHIKVPAAARPVLDPGVTWFGWHVPVLVEVAVVLAIGLICLGVAIWEFSTSE